MDRSEASALADLQMHWDEAYAIGLDGDIWLARFHGSADELRAHTSHELRELIRADYARRQQARAARPGSARPDMGGADRGGTDMTNADLAGTDLDSDRGYGYDLDEDASEDPSEDPRQDSDSRGGHAGNLGAACPAKDNFVDIRGERMST